MKRNVFKALALVMALAVLAAFALAEALPEELNVNMEIGTPDEGLNLDLGDDSIPGGGALDDLALGLELVSGEVEPGRIVKTYRLLRFAVDGDYVAKKITLVLRIPNLEIIEAAGRHVADFRVVVQNGR